MSKKLQAKQDRRLAEQRRKDAQRKAARRGNLVTLGIAVAVVAAVASIVVADNLGAVPATGRCTPLERHEIEGNTHVEPGTDVAYRTNPPTSGDHLGTPADPAFYTAPLPEEALVHNLEHGQIVIWYRPDAPQEVLEDIETVVDQQAVATLAAPYEGLEEPYQLGVSAWGASISCEQVSQKAIDELRTRFQGRGPEQKGIPTFTPDEG